MKGNELNSGLSQKGLGFSIQAFCFFQQKHPLAGLQLPRTNWMTKSYYNIIQWKNKPIYMASSSNERADQITKSHNIIQWKNKPIYIIPWYHHPMKEWTASSSNERMDRIAKSHNIIQLKNKPIYVIPWHHHPMKEWTTLQNPITSSSNERTNPFA